MCMSEDNTHRVERSDNASLPAAGENHPCVLLAEDDDEMRRMLAGAFRADGYRVTECADGFALLEVLGTSLFRADSPHYDVVVSDVRMPGLTGLDILKSVHKRGGDPPFILITAFGDEETHTEAERLGVAAVFDKPFRIEHLLDAVHKVVASPSRT